MSYKKVFPPLSTDMNFTATERDAIKLITENLFFYFYCLNGHIFLNIRGRHMDISENCPYGVNSVSYFSFNYFIYVKKG